MLVQCVYNDTQTGEEETADLQINEFNGESLRQAIESHFSYQTGENESLALEAFVLDRNKRIAVFVLRDLHDSSYGGFLIHGTASIR